MSTENAQLERLLLQGGFDSAETRVRIQKFYETVVQENKIQNLTRLESPEDFYFGHILDVMELLSLKCVDYPAMDLGSGVGIPGLLTALIESNQWVLVESEKMKAEYLKRAVDSLNLGSDVSVVARRAEEYLKNAEVQSVVVRAVGTVEKIYTWIHKSSTWNNLILFKGPGWEEEWQKFLQSKYRTHLQIEMEHAYTVGPENKKRKIIKLKRVPRGTIR